MAAALSDVDQLRAESDVYEQLFVMSLFNFRCNDIGLAIFLFFRIPFRQQCQIILASAANFCTCFIISGRLGSFKHDSPFLRPSDIHVGGLIFYHGFFLSFFLSFFFLFSPLNLRAH